MKVSQMTRDMLTTLAKQQGLAHTEFTGHDAVYVEGEAHSMTITLQHYGMMFDLYIPAETYDKAQEKIIRDKYQVIKDNLA